MTIELTNIFNLLKKCAIDADILQVNKERATAAGEKIEEDREKITTLFDYISDQEIIELQRQADDEIGEIEVRSSLVFPFHAHKFMKLPF